MRMPEVLANATEAIIAKWLLEEGASFSVGQSMAEVETEKALVEVPAETDGILGKYLAKNGAHVQVGAPIAILLAKGEGQAEIDKLMAEAGADIPAPAPAPAAPAPVAPAAPTPAPVAAAPAPVAPPTPVVATDRGSRVFASPLARRLAKENGLDAGSINGTGPGGRIVRRDVQAAIANGGAKAPATS